MHGESPAVILHFPGPKRSVRRYLDDVAIVFLMVAIFCTRCFLNIQGDTQCVRNADRMNLNLENDTVDAAAMPKTADYHVD